MKLKTGILAGMIGWSVAGLGISDPIADGPAFGPYDARWVASASTPCPTACAAALASTPEWEAYNAPTINNVRTFDCKSRVATTTPTTSGWLYGNNFQSPARNRYCMVTTPGGLVLNQQYFQCLCIQ